MLGFGRIDGSRSQHAYHSLELAAVNLGLSWSFMACGGDVKHHLALIQFATRNFDLHSLI